MKKTMRKVLAYLLAVSMIVTFMPTAAFALDGAPGNAGGDDAVNAEAEAMSFAGQADNGMNVLVSAPASAFPAGTAMEVKSVSADQVLDAVSGAVEGNVKSIKAVDITFYDKDGTEIEPAAPVSVKMFTDGMSKDGEKTVFHMNGDTPENMGEAHTNGLLTFADFQSDAFSIYLVVEEDQDEDHENAVATYEFYVDGKLVETQYHKTGDKITDPGSLTIGADDANTVFKGWFIGDTAVDFDTTLTVDKTEVVRVDAKIQHTYYVTFWGEEDEEGNRGIVSVKSVTVEGTETGTVTTSNVSVTPKKDTSAFEGWTSTPNGTELVEDSVTVSGRMDLYAVVVDANWLHFYENVPEDSDSDATYTGPVYVAKDELRSAKKPVDPTRRGYTFDGWYTDEQCTDSNAFDWTAMGLDADTNLYAKWIPSEAKYHVIIWKQKVTDAKDAVDNAKTYDFESSVEMDGTTGQKLDLDTYKAYKDLSFTGFHFGRIEASTETVRADGTTVVNVYYDRNLLTINFVDGTELAYVEAKDNERPQYGKVDGTEEYFQLDRHRRNNSYYWTYDTPQKYEGPTYSQANGTGGTQYGFANGQMVELTYHQVFLGGYWTYGDYEWYDGTRYTTPAKTNSGFGIVDDEVVGISNQDGEWTYVKEVEYTGTRYKITTQPKTTKFTGLYGSTLAANGYTWPSNRAWYQNPNGGGTRLTFLDAFKFEGLSGTSENNTVLTQYGANQSGTNYIGFYKQNIDETYPQDNAYTDRIRSSSGTFTITEKYEGFKAVQYTNGGSWTTGGAGTSTSTNNLQIRFERQKYSLSFVSEGEVIETKGGIPYEDTLSGYRINDPTKAHYDFKGWYEDPTGQRAFDWTSTMPAANKVLYAKWTPKEYHVSLNPNGGSFQNAQVGEFNVPLDTILDKTSLTQNVTKEGHELIGWFIKNDDDSAGEAYGYGKIEDDVNLIAKWRYPGQVQIDYEAGEHGSGAPEDDYKYATDSSVVLGAPPTTVYPGYAFVGWNVGGKKYYTNNTFDITEKLIKGYSDDTKTGTITITAIYQNLSEGGYTPTTITYNANGGTGNDVIVNTGGHGYLRVNEPIKAKTIAQAGFTRPGYDFTGWNTDPNGGGLDVTEDVDIAGDLRNPEKNTNANTLYAQWEAQKFTVTWKSQDGKTAYETDENVVAESKPSYDKSEPTKDADAQYTYTFAGWATSPNAESGKAVTELPAVTDNAIYYAAFTKTTNKYTVTFVDEDGTTILKDETAYDYGTKAADIVKPADPTKPEDANYTYSFAGWTPTIADVTGDATYKATYDRTPKGGGDGPSPRPTPIDPEPVPLDLTTDHYAYVEGYDDGTVKPDGSITRAETATMIYRLLTIDRRDEIFTDQNNYSDVDQSMWYNKAVSSMTNGEYINGYPDGTFGGNQTITRAEFVTILVRFLDGPKEGENPFSDVSGHWAEEYIVTAVQAGWIDGYPDGTFKPGEPISRAEALKIMNSVLHRGVNEESELGDYINFPDNSDSSKWYYYEIIEAVNSHECEGERPNENWTANKCEYEYDIDKYERPEV